MAKATTKTVGDPARPMVYLGPNMSEPGFFIQSTMIYSNGLPPDVSARCDNDPDFKRLIVPESGVAKATADLRDKSTPLAQAYSRVLNAYLERKTTGGAA